MFAGLGAARIRRLFAIARSHEPAIIFIDELDAVGGRRGNDISGEKDQTLNQLLVEMDGFDSAGRVVVIAASNLLEKLDPALLRPGRFDRQVFVVPPDVRGRLGVLQVHTRSKPMGDVDLELVAQQTSGLTGADLANICNEAAIFAARRKATKIDGRDFDAAIERVIAGVQSKRVLGSHEKRVVAYHEAGHALCGELLPSVDRVHRISIVPRGRALGYTLNLPAEDRYLKTREELLDYMTMLLGGRVAEQIVFGAITTGASDDLKRVADIAHSMVHDYAMGTAGVGRSPDGDVQALGDHAPAARRRAPCAGRGGAQGGPEDGALPSRPARRAGRGAARARGARARVDRPDHEGRAASGASAGRRPAGRGGRRHPSSGALPPRRSCLRRLRRRASANGYRLRLMFSRIDHIGVAVAEIEPALELYRDRFDLSLAHREVVEEQGVEAVLLDVGENHVELLAPLGEDTPVGKFLARQGPGLHHVAYQVSDIEATLEALKQAGLELIDQEPRIGIRGSRVAFMHPRASMGVLTEIVQPATGTGGH